MQGGVGSSVRRVGGLCASHSASWVCWAGFKDLRPKAASPRGTPREGSGSLSPPGNVVDGFYFFILDTDDPQIIKKYPLIYIVFIFLGCTLNDLFSNDNLYNTFQSSYRPGHSTETALLKVANDIFLYINKGNLSILPLLDFSSAFYKIDRSILVHRFHTDFGFTDAVLQ